MSPGSHRRLRTDGGRRADSGATGCVNGESLPLAKTTTKWNSLGPAEIPEPEERRAGVRAVRRGRQKLTPRPWEGDVGGTAPAARSNQGGVSRVTRDSSRQDTVFFPISAFFRVRPRLLTAELHSPRPHYDLYYDLSFRGQTVVHSASIGNPSLIRHGQDTHRQRASVGPVSFPPLTAFK